jgi:hypothetical protein
MSVCPGYRMMGGGVAGIQGQPFSSIRFMYGLFSSDIQILVYYAYFEIFPLDFQAEVPIV